ncbi:MAG: aldo/keto reductase [Clostridia bacterium]|nr:aldo/keto reductase [Clostridia bacterium]
MFEKFTDTAVLSNGVEVPCIGYGTWQTPDGETARNCVKNAIELGYRHIDTAAAYGNEASVGEGIRDSGVKRDELFITTKHWISERGYEKTVKAVETSLTALGLDYLDLYLIHWPMVKKIDENWEEINADTWRGFEKMYKDGKIRAIGVSNFLPHHLESLKKNSTIAPMVNQIEFHPGYSQPEVVDYCKKENILVQAWSPLGSGAVLKDEFLAGIAAKYNKSVAQLCIRYAIQNGIVPLPKSTNRERVADNMKVFDFSISAEDMEKIANMDVLGYSGFYPDDAPADVLYG